MKKVLLATALLLMFVGCGTETKIKYVDKNITVEVEKIVEVPVEVIVEVEVPTDVYVYQNYTSQVNFEDLRVDITCLDGNCTASILEYNCYLNELSAGPHCKCDYFPIKGYTAEIACTECDACATASSSEEVCVEESSAASSSEESCYPYPSCIPICEDFPGTPCVTASSSSAIDCSQYSTDVSGAHIPEECLE